MSYTIRVKGLDEARSILGERFDRAIDAALEAISEQLVTEIKPYPPATSANQPKTWGKGARNSWYERGFGTKWITKGGEIHGRATSQKLGIRWAVGRIAPLRWAIRNMASYAEAVHSAEKQAWFHRERGWRTEKYGLERLVQSGAIDRIFRMAFRYFFRGR